MNVIIVVATLTLFVSAAPQQRGGPDKDAVIVKLENNNIGVDGYNFNYETSNGIQQQEQGQLAAAPEGEAIAVRGQFSFVGADGVTYTVTYTADENGFVAQGAHIPQA